MLSEQEAIAKLKKYEPYAKAEKIVIYNGLYIILAPRKDDSVEGNYDPFYSVDMETGATQDYSILKDGKAREIDLLFQKAPDI